MKEPNENDSLQKTKFYSSDAPSPSKPELVINYNPYYGTRPYQPTRRKDINCMGYALEYEAFVFPSEVGLSEDAMYEMNIEQVKDRFLEVIVPWMNLHLGVSNWSFIDSYDSDINENWYRVYCMLGFGVDESGGIQADDILNGNENIDFHWLYQTNENYWAQKAGESSTSQEALSSDDFLPTGMETGFISVPIFFQVRDMRDINWQLSS